MVGLIRFRTAVILPVGLALLAGCGDWRHHKGFKIVADGNDRHKVVHLSETVVGPDITQWGIYKDYLILYKTSTNEAGKWADLAGYVFIDTDDGQTTFAATQKEYEAIAVQQLDIPLIETTLTPI